MKLHAVLLASAALCAAAASAPAQRITVNTGNKINCTTAKGETGFEASDFQIGGTAAGILPGSGAGASKPVLSTLNIAKQFDSCSAQLIQAFLSLKSLPAVTLTNYRIENGAPLPILTIALTNSRISNYQLSSGGDIPTETVSFAYQTVCITSVTTTPQGTAGDKTTVCYDAAKNVVSSN